MLISKKFSALFISCLCMTSVVMHADEKKMEEIKVTEHSHDQEYSDKGMVLNDGKKWKTDAPLRKGMQSIYNKVNKAEKAFSSKSLTQEEGKSLALHINKELMFMVENCELQPKADASLHVIIGEMMQGIGKLSKAPNSEGGFPRINKALKQYPKFFNHPDLMK